MLKTLAAGIILFLSISSFAQKDFHFETFTTRDGLSSNEIRSLLRDSRGFLWVGTTNGLNRFDGYRFYNFTPNPRAENSLGGEVVMALAESPTGQIWIAHNRGLDIYDPPRDTFLRVPPLPGKEPYWSFNQGSSITFTQSGYALLTQNAEWALLFEPNSLAYTEIFAPQVPPQQRPKTARGATVQTLVMSTLKSGDEVWIASTYGIFSLDVVSCDFQFHHLKGIDWNYWPGTLYHDAERELLWFNSFTQSLYSYAYRTGHWKQWDIPLSGAIMSTNDLCGTPMNGIWVNTPGILYPEKDQLVPVPHIPDDYSSFPKASSICALHDKEGILWIGTSRGLCKLDPSLQGFHHIHLKDHSPMEYDNSVYEVFQNDEDNQWYITSFYTGQFFVYDPATGHQREITNDFTPAFPKEAPTRIIKDTRGITWILTGGGLYEAKLKDRKLIPIKMPPLPEGVGNRATFDIVEDYQGDLWVAKWRAGLLRYDRQLQSLSYIYPPDSLGVPNTAFVLATNSTKEHLWVGSQGAGIFHLDIKANRWEKLTEIIIDGHHINLIDITGLTMDRNNDLWIATRVGLVRLSPNGASKLFTQEDGLINGFLEGIRADGRGHIWLATSNGIAMLNIDTLEVRNFDERHGLKIDANLDYFSIQPDGTIFSGTKQGFIYFHPDSLLQDNKPPKLAILSFKTRGIEHTHSGLVPDYWKKVRLKPNEDFFTIEYVGINFTLPAENTYYYKLQGLDEDWIDAGKRRIANYTSVPPGDYIFCLKAKNKDGTWSTQEKQLAIYIAPPFWQTYWFWMLALLVIGGTVYGIYHIRIQQIRREEEMKAEFTNKLAEVEMAALRSQMNPHFLFNCLNSINRFIQRNEPDLASSYLTKFSRLIRLVLDHSRTDSISLRDELDALRLYIELEAMRFVGRFSYVFDIAEDLETHSIEIPPMLIQPYVENAIWHGLMHKENGDGRLTIKVYTGGNRLFIEVEDNGIGRRMAALLKSKSATLHKSHGMKVTAERIEIINEIYEAKTVVEIEDLTDLMGKAAGTKVKLSLTLT